MLATNKFINRHVTDWEVTNEVSMSDHKIIEFKIKAISNNNVPLRNPRKTNREKYLECLKAGLVNINNVSYQKHR